MIRSFLGATARTGLAGIFCRSDAPQKPTTEFFEKTAPREDSAARRERLRRSRVFAAAARGACAGQAIAHGRAL